MQSIALVSMPFGSHRIPKLSLSLLKGRLKQDKIKCDIHLLDLVFASQIGLDNYEIIAEKFNPALLVGDWLFSPELFKADAKSDREYIDLLLSDITEQKEIVALPGVLKLIELRDKIPGFLKYCLESIDWSSYTVVGFSTSNQQNCACLALAKLIKKSYPNIKIVFGGANCFGPMAKAMIRSFDFIDFICTGEGDLSFPLLINSLLKKHQASADSIPGMLSCSQIRSGLDKSLPLPVEDMNALAYPDFSEYFSYLKKYKSLNNFQPQIPIETSRGCWWGKLKRCSFCGHCFDPDETFKSKASKRVMEEVNYLSDKYISTFRVSDDIMDYDYYNTLLPNLSKANSRATFFWEVKANISKKQMSILSKAGVNRIQPGIESLSDDILKLINKGTTQIINISTLKWAKEFNVHASWNLLYGFPGEDHREYDKIIKLMPLLYHLEPPFGFSHVRFERFSSYVKDPASFNIENLCPSKIYGLIYPGIDRKNIQDLAFYFDAEYADYSKKYEKELLSAIEKWRKREDAALDLFSFKDSIKINDARDPKKKLEFSFNGLKARIYQLCDKARNVKLLLDEPEVNTCIDEKGVQAILDDYIDKGLMIENNSKYLSLAVMQKTYS